MSIIQEALKRKEEMQSPPGVSPPPHLPPPPIGRFAPPHVPPEETPKRKKRVGVWVTVILGVVLLGVGAVGVVLLGAWYFLAPPMASETPEVVDLVVPHPSRPATPGDNDSGSGLFVPLVTPVERVVVRDPEPDVTAPSLSAVPWPEVRVSAIMAPGGSMPGTVNISGAMMGVGDTIKGIRVVRIDHGEVLLEFEGARRLLHVGQTTGQ